MVVMSGGVGSSNVGVGGGGFGMGNGRAWEVDLRSGSETEGVGVEG